MTHDAVLVHRMLRRESATAPLLVRGVPPGDLSRAGRVADRVECVLRSLIDHHRAEEEVLWPLLVARTPGAVGLRERMGCHRVELDVLVDDALVTLARWRAQPAACPEPLASQLEAVARGVAAQVDREEAEVLPLVPASVSPDEWLAVGAAARRHVPQDRLFTELGLILRDASSAERARVLGTLPLALRLLFLTVGERAFRREEARLRLP
ncbi:hemerythrin domain-containing protein [Streptacidiphilus monticola]|uniref:Hemerythrin domain-containing protein n=1 Tax=Streptacidiphilus monticola TaxID=2161674 RepID=A0ABW1G8C1_9ACTN